MISVRPITDVPIQGKRTRDAEQCPRSTHSCWLMVHYFLAARTQTNQRQCTSTFPHPSSAVSFVSLPTDPTFHSHAQNTDTENRVHTKCQAPSMPMTKVSSPVRRKRIKVGRDSLVSGLSTTPHMNILVLCLDPWISIHAQPVY
jgi:hypothetical protein